MRIVLMGQAAFGAKVFEALKEKGENIVAVYTPAEKPGARPDPLKEAAASGGTPVYQPARYKDDQSFDQFKSLEPDLAVLAFVTDIIPARYFDACAQGAICYHPSILPRHRGASAINWAVIMGDTATGLTIFWPDGGIDTGPILLQKEVAIGPDDTTGSLYFNHLFPMGVDAILESVALIKEGKAPKIAQSEVGATYEPPCDDRVAAIDWQKPAQQIHNLVRGCDPQPGAYTIWKGEKVRFYGVKLLAEGAAAGKEPGTVLQIDEKGMHIVVPGGILLADKVRGAKGGKVAATDFAAERGIQVGDRLG